MNSNTAPAARIMKKNIFLFAILLSMASTLGACSTAPTEYSEDGAQISDPFERTNRMVFAFNNAVDDAVIHPVIKGYRAAVPQPARSGLRNFLRNLKSPVLFANQTLQGDLEGAGNVALRATINTLVGVGGLFDVAGKEGIPYEQEDFGQTLGVWGVGHGPYIVVPVLGPSSLRDYAGYFVDAYADPLRWYLFNTDREAWYYAKVGVEYLDLRESLLDTLEDIERSSIDYYAAVRSIYHQQRKALTEDRASAPGDAATAMPDYYDEL